MIFYFFDASALMKRYHQETGSDRVDAILEARDSVSIISELSLIEMASALQRKRNRGEITLQAMNDALARFANDVLSDWVVAAFRSGFIQQARELVLRRGIRTLDALQLTAALAFSGVSPVFVCADARLRQAAAEEGLAVLDPEAAE